MQQIEAEVKQRSPALWRWTFKSTSELRRALEEYANALGVQPFTLNPLPPNASDVVDARMAETDLCRAKQRSEIDRRMEVLRVRAPFWYKLLDGLYRRGACEQREDWRKVAVSIGVEARPDREHPWDRDVFWELVPLAIERLFHAKRGDA